MRSLQERLLSEFERIAADAGFETVQQAQWGNTGKLLAVPAVGPYQVQATLHYDIQSGLSKLWFNGADQLSPWLLCGPDDSGARLNRLTQVYERRNPDVFYVEATDADRIQAAFDRWAELLKGGAA